MREGWAPHTLAARVLAFAQPAPRCCRRGYKEGEGGHEGGPKEATEDRGIQCPVEYCGTRRRCNIDSTNIMLMRLGLDRAKRSLTTFLKLNFYSLLLLS